MNWIVTNSPNTTITLLAIFGIILIVAVAFDTASKFARALAYVIAIIIYYPYCYINDRIKQKNHNNPKQHLIS